MVGETVIFNALVDKSALRRRASRLLAIAGAPKRKTRELVLTDRRLVCLKHKPGRPYQLSNELSLKPLERDKDSRHTVIGAEPKGEREFVVMTVGVMPYKPVKSSHKNYRVRNHTRISHLRQHLRKRGSVKFVRPPRKPTKRSKARSLPLALDR